MLGRFTMPQKRGGNTPAAGPTCDIEMWRRGLVRAGTAVGAGLATRQTDGGMTSSREDERSDLPLSLLLSLSCVCSTVLGVEGLLKFAGGAVVDVLQEEDDERCWASL